MKFLKIVSIVIIGVLFACKDKAKEVAFDPNSLEHLEQRINKNPKDAEAYYLRAQYYYNNNYFPLGIEDINRAIKLDSIRYQYYLLKADLNYVQNKIEEVKAALEKAYSLNSESEDVLLKYGEFQFILQNYESFFELINKALRANPYNAKAYYMKGMAYLETGDTNLAISSLQTATEQDAEYYKAFFELGLIFLSKNNPLAIQYFQNAIQINPNKSESLYALAMSYQQFGMFELAIETYFKLLEKEPSNPFAYHNIGYIQLFEFKNPDEAIRYFTLSIEANNKYKESYFHRGYAYEVKGMKDAARMDYQNAISIDPDYVAPKERISKLGNTRK